MTTWNGPENEVGTGDAGFDSDVVQFDDPNVQFDDTGDELTNWTKDE